MDTPQFVQEGYLTPEGLKVKAWMESIFVEADKTNDLAKINSLSGHVGSYYLHAYKGGGKGFGVTPEQWFAENKSSAMAAHRDMLYFEGLEAQEAERVAAINENAQTTSALAEKLEALREQVRVLTEALAAKDAPAVDETEQAEETEPVEEAAPVEEVKPKRGRKAKVVEAEAEAEAEQDADAETEQAEEEADAEQGDGAEADADADSKS